MLTDRQRSNVRVVLVRTRNPLNIGAAARAMSNFGFTELRLVRPYEPSFREARSAVGATELLKRAEQYPDVACAVADCKLVLGTTAIRNRKLDQPLRRLAQAAASIRSAARSGPVAILFGSEKIGLSNQELSHCQWLLHIPARPDHVSMNLGQAVAVVLYELARSNQTEAPVMPSRAASAGDLERLTGLLLESALASGFAHEAQSDGNEQKLRRLIRRLNLSGEDAELLLGMMRQTLWKLRK